MMKNRMKIPSAAGIVARIERDIKRCPLYCEVQSVAYRLERHKGWYYWRGIVRIEFDEKLIIQPTWKVQSLDDYSDETIFTELRFNGYNWVNAMTYKCIERIYVPEHYPGTIKRMIYRNEWPWLYGNGKGI